MKQADNGDKVLVHYTGTLADGTVFDSSVERDPLEITIGGGQVIPGFEQALVGMTEGDQKDVTLAPEEAYGPHHPELVQTVSREQIPANVSVTTGNVLQAQDQAGNSIRLVVTDSDDDTVTLDGNHPLAGKALTFDLTLVGFTS